ncbi:isochorismatase family protein [Sarocladium implicatum]|nr:isochorismatase family protein [Sarocladium implicatum]
MTRYSTNDSKTPPIQAKGSTALLVVQAQLGYRDKTAWGSDASNPSFDQNLKALVDKFRMYQEAEESPIIIHVQYRPVWTDHPLHVSKKGPYGPNGEEKRAIDFLEYAAPRNKTEDGWKYTFTFDEPTAQAPQAADHLRKNKGPRRELLMSSHGHSVFTNTPLVHLLNEHGVKTLIIAGLALDHSISTTVRQAQNLALVGRWGGRGNRADVPSSWLWTEGAGVYALAKDHPDAEDSGDDGYMVDMPRIILARDATRTFAKGGIDAQTYHRVHVESLRDFAEVRTVSELIEAFDCSV